MKTPGLKIVREAKANEIEKVETIIRDSLEVPCILCKPIEMFTIPELELLSEYAKENDILISLKSEHSNFHQGTLVQLVRKKVLNSDTLDTFIEYV